MAETAAMHSPPARRWWLRVLYAVLAVAAVALLLMVAGEIVYSFEEADEHQTHSHGFYGPIFDGAFFVFLPTVLITFAAGLAALLTGWLRRSPELRTYGTLALGFCVAAVGVIVIEESMF
jgi:protein-S-isoprenylcysteine O-methyltransferase Ste14